MRGEARSFVSQPLVSILTPVFDTPVPWLREAVDSVFAQIYENWELCIADDASSDQRVRRVLDEYLQRDSRIKVVFRTENGHISRATAHPSLLGVSRPSPEVVSVRSLPAFALFGVDQSACWRIPPSFGRLLPFVVRPPSTSLGIGVGHIAGDDPDPVAPVRGPDSRSRNNSAPHLVAERFQVSVYALEAVRHLDDASNVLQQAPTGPEGGHNPTQFRPEIAVVVHAALDSGHTPRLAGKAAGEQVDGSARDHRVSDVIGDRHPRPVFGQHPPAPRVAFDKADRLDASGPRRRQREAALNRCRKTCQCGSTSSASLGITSFLHQAILLPNPAAGPYSRFGYRFHATAPSRAKSVGCCSAGSVASDARFFTACR